MMYATHYQALTYPNTNAEHLPAAQVAAVAEVQLLRDCLNALSLDAPERVGLVRDMQSITYLPGWDDTKTDKDA